MKTRYFHKPHSDNYARAKGSMVEFYENNGYTEITEEEFLEKFPNLREASVAEREATT